MLGWSGPGPLADASGGECPWERWTVWKGTQHTRHAPAPPPPSTGRLPEHPAPGPIRTSVAGTSRPRDNTAPPPHLPPWSSSGLRFRGQSAQTLTFTFRSARGLPGPLPAAPIRSTAGIIKPADAQAPPWTSHQGWEAEGSMDHRENCRPQEAPREFPPPLTGQVWTLDQGELIHN